MRRYVARRRRAKPGQGARSEASVSRSLPPLVSISREHNGGLCKMNVPGVGWGGTGDTMDNLEKEVKNLRP